MFRDQAGLNIKICQRANKRSCRQKSTAKPMAAPDRINGNVTVNKVSAQNGGHRLNINEYITSFQSRYIGGKWLGAQLRSHPTTTPGLGTDDADPAVERLF